MYNYCGRYTTWETWVPEYFRDSELRNLRTSVFELKELYIYPRWSASSVSFAFYKKSPSDKSELKSAEISHWDAFGTSNLRVSPGGMPLACSPLKNPCKSVLIRGIRVTIPITALLHYWIIGFSKDPPPHAQSHPKLPSRRSRWSWSQFPNPSSG